MILVPPDESNGLAFGRGGINGAAGGGGGFTVFADSVGGNDANSGLTALLPKQTLSAAIAIAGTGARIGLAKGSHWREAMDLTSLTTPTVGAYGTGATPIVDGSVIFTGWTAYTTGGVVNMYQKAATNVANASNRMTVYEDGVLLVRVATDAACDALAGSFVDPWNGSTTPANAVIRIHPYGSTNATSDGKVREISIRLMAIQGPANCSISDVTGRGSWNNNGHIDLVARTGGTIERCVSIYGTKHSLGMGSGTMRDCIAAYTDIDTARAEGINPFIAYLPDGTGYIHRWIRCGGFSYGYQASDFESHGAPTGLDSVTGEQIWQVNPADTFAYAQALNEITGAYYKDVVTLPLNLGTVRFVQARINKYGTYNSTGQYGAVSLSDSVVLLANRYTASPVNNNVVLTPEGNTTLQRGAFYGLLDGSHLMRDGSAANTLTVNKCVFFGGARHIDIPSGRTYVGDFNVFYQSVDASQLYNYQGGFHTTLAAWQASCGQDASSVYLVAADQTAGNANAFWLGVANSENDGPADGDWRINPHCRVYKTGAVALQDNGPGGLTAFADDTTLITTAGPQDYWDWDARASASGPPTQWPTPPASLAEAEEYILDPAAWAFYPTDPTPGAFDYFRPDGVSYYLRPGGTDYYTRP